MKFRARGILRNPRSGKPLGSISIGVRALTKKAAKSKMGRLVKRHLKNVRVHHNVEEGHWDATGFHPHRASSDYSRSRAGEGKHGGKARAKKYTRKARPMH